MEPNKFKYIPETWTTGRPEDLQAAILCIRAQLLLVADFARTVDSCPDLGKRQMLHMESAHEQVTHGLLDEMRLLIQKIAHTPAQNRRELVAKAKVWLSDEVSKSDDDVLALATSICQDLMRLNEAEV